MLWINGGGGVVVDQNEKNVHFNVERHGVSSLSRTVGTTYVTTHWIHSCLEVSVYYRILLCLIYSLDRLHSILDTATCLSGQITI